MTYLIIWFSVMALVVVKFNKSKVVTTKHNVMVATFSVASLRIIQEISKVWHLW